MIKAERVVGWDVLRGVCAAAVATYHLLLWLDVVAIHSIGSYCVYVFFVLSGASLGYAYADAFQDGTFCYRRFLWLRYARIAPLYLTLLVAVLPYKILKHGLDATLVQEVLLNASFLFGLFDPASTAMLVGGWSLGIEAVMYLLFPLLMTAALINRLRWVVFVLLMILQFAWIELTVADGLYRSNLVLYHQVPAFAGYFMGGCLLGVMRKSRAGSLAGSNELSGVAVAISLATIVLANPGVAGQELLGWRGVLLSGLCFFLVWTTGNWTPRATTLLQCLGEASYGLYLIHPILFFALSWIVLPRLGLGPIESWTLHSKLVVALTVLTGATVVGWFAERYLELPLRQRSKALCRPRQSETSSISL